jgi:hypothetical protein
LCDALDFFAVIACNKRKAFVQGSARDEAIQTSLGAFWIASLALAMTEEIAPYATIST